MSWFLLRKNGKSMRVSREQLVDRLRRRHIVIASPAVIRGIVRILSFETIIVFAPSSKKATERKKGEVFSSKWQRLSLLLIDQIGRRLFVEIGRSLMKWKSYFHSCYDQRIHTVLHQIKASRLNPTILAQTDVSNLIRAFSVFTQIDERNRQDPLIERGVRLERVVCSMTLL